MEITVEGNVICAIAIQVDVVTIVPLMYVYLTLLEAIPLLKTSAKTTRRILVCAQVKKKIEARCETKFYEVIDEFNEVNEPFTYRLLSSKD